MKNIHHKLFVIALVLLSLSLALLPEFQKLVFRHAQLDTIGHFIGFFCLTWLIVSVAKLPFLPSTVALICYAGFSELGQYYLGYRNGEVSDFIANTLGILLFVALKSSSNAVRNKRE